MLCTVAAAHRAGSGGASWKEMRGYGGWSVLSPRQGTGPHPSSLGFLLPSAMPSGNTSCWNAEHTQATAAGCNQGPGGGNAPGSGSEQIISSIVLAVCTAHTLLPDRFLQTCAKSTGKVNSMWHLGVGPPQQLRSFARRATQDMQGRA